MIDQHQQETAEESNMIPFRDKNPKLTTPYVTWALILFNIFAFLYERAMLEGGYARFVSDWGFVPARFLHDPSSEAVTILTSMFLHGGWLHLGGNMLFLWIFGDDIEDRLGHLRYLSLYLAWGVAAAMGQLAIDPGSFLPIVGASGAIAGVLGAYLFSYPRVRVEVVLPIFVFWQRFELPAWVVIGEWFVLQLISGFGSLAAPGVGGGVAFFAHIGGFLAGFATVAIFFRKDPRVPDPDSLDAWIPPPRLPERPSRWEA